MCISFDEYSEDWEHGLKQVIVFGKAYLVDGGPEFDRDAALLNEKFPQYPVSTYPIVPETTVIIEIRPVAGHQLRALGSGPEAQRYRSKKSRISCMCCTWPATLFAWWPSG